MSITWEEHYDFIKREAGETRDEMQRPFGVIQWKGTTVCMDVHCACGAHLHADAEFMYYVECPHCRRLYALGFKVNLVELTGEQAAYARRERETLIVSHDGERGDLTADHRMPIAEKKS